MKKILISESEKRRILNMHLNNAKKEKLINEAIIGIVKKGDDICSIFCNIKVARTGSSGDVVKMIQHVLANLGISKKTSGGGMTEACATDWTSCDGIFHQKTKEAVIEFQRSVGTTDDGIVGSATLDKMCEKFKGSESLSFDEFCKKCDCQNQNTEDGDDNYMDPDLKNVNCESLKYCLFRYINPTKPEWSDFYECVKLKRDDGDKGKDLVFQCLYRPTNQRCPEWTDQMPKIGGPTQKMNDMIQACVKAGCTKIAI